MRHLTRQDVSIQRLLRVTRTIAIIGPSRRMTQRSRQVVDALRRFGYDVVPVRRDRAEIDGLRSFASLAEVPGQIDLAVVFGSAADAAAAIAAAAAKRVEAVWLAPGVPTVEAEALARQHGVALVVGRDIVAERRTQQLGRAGAKLGVHLRRRKTSYEDNRQRRPRGGWIEGGGGGRLGGGGGRATLDEKKMVAGKPSPRTGPLKRRRPV